MTLRVRVSLPKSDLAPFFVRMKVASLANLVALLAMNASFCAIDARSVQVIKALEPAFTILISAVAFQKMPSLSKVGAAMLICFGVGLSTAPSSLNIAGMTLGLVAASGMPVRNLLLKEVESQVEVSPLGQYFYLCWDGLIVTLPFWLAKSILRDATPCLPFYCSLAAVSFLGYNVASMLFLARVSPLTHSTANCLKQMVSSLLTGYYFGMPWPATLIVGMVLTAIGLLWYSFADRTQVCTLCTRTRFLLGLVVGAAAAAAAFNLQLV